MNMRQQRHKEDNLMEKLKDPDKEHSSDISRLINNTLQAGHKVLLGCDWHLWLRDEKNKPACHKRSDFNAIINSFKNGIGPEDLFIFMGDLVDGEFQNKDELKAVIQNFGKKMIMVRGNNDLFPDSFYKECGFRYIVDSFVWNHIIFTHVPVENKYDLNIHAHLHGYHTYIIPYTNQIDIGWLGGRKTPVNLKTCMLAQPRYAKIIKIDQQHFGEQSIDVFHQQYQETPMYIDDPYHDAE